MGLDDIKYYVIGIIMFMLVIGGGVYMTGSFFNSNPNLDNAGELSNFESKLYQERNITNSVNSLDQSISSVNAADTGVLGWLNVLLGAAFNGLKLIGDSLDFMAIVANQAGLIFGVPSWIVSLLSLIAVLVVVFAIYSVITRT